MVSFQTVGVAGAGSWGTALALSASRAGRDAMLWGRDKAVLSEIETTGRNNRYLPDLIWQDPLKTTADLDDLASCDLVILATPAQTTRSMARKLARHLPVGTPVVLTAKGLEMGSLKLVADVFLEEAPDLVPVILSGPSFAMDVASGLPTAVTIAAADIELARSVSEALRGPALRLYASDDLVGVQLGGALKNVMAIAAGIVEGKAYGVSARAALISRGFAELSRLSSALGARTETLGGLSGLGDLVLCCSSEQSRNYSFGLSLGRGLSIEELTAPGAKLAEGAITASVAADLAQSRGIDTPVIQAIAAVITGKLDIDAAVQGLMNRPVRTEF